MANLNKIRINDKEFQNIDNALVCINEELSNSNLNEMNFKFQNGTIKEVGENGLQWYELLKISLTIVQNLNANFPCRENDITITKIEEALMWQNKRTENRIARGVEGLSQA